MMEMGQQIAVSGIILPDEWDENGEVIAFAIYTDLEEVFKLEHNNSWRALMSFICKKVKLTGKLIGHPDENKSIIEVGYSVPDQDSGDE